MFALRSHLAYHVMHNHMLMSSGKKTPCPWKNCRDKFKSTATKEVSSASLIHLVVLFFVVVYLKNNFSGEVQENIIF